MADEKGKQTLPMYKGKPLVRSGRTLYYGDPSEAYVAMLQIFSAKNTDAGIPISDKVLVQIISTNEDLPLKDRVIKTAEQKGLYEALRIASIWLERPLAEAES